MRAADVMVREVVTVRSETPIADAVELLTKHDISALPVVDDANRLIGILSEADLIRRVELGTEKQRPWFLESLTGATTLASEFARAHGRTVGEIMTTDIVSADEDTPLEEIAGLFERRRIKRVPIVRDGVLVGVLSRSNLIQALASRVGAPAAADSDRRIRDEVLRRLEQQDWTDFGSRNVTVSGGVVHLWGLISNEAERRALTALAEEVPGVAAVKDEMFAIY